MIRQIPGKIYLADQRGQSGNNNSRRFSTFNFENYYHEDKRAFGSLYVFNEELFAGGYSEEYQVEQDTYLLIIPVTGALNVTVSNADTLTVDVEEVQLNFVPANSTFTLQNPYTQENITFLQVWIRAENTFVAGVSERYSFEFSGITNNLKKVITAREESSTSSKIPFSFSIGNFAGRQEVVYTLENKTSCFFAFVIAGAFELEGRLMHEKDGLALWETEEVELEALSNNALVIVLEQVAL